MIEQLRAWVNDRDLVAELADWISRPSVSRTGEGMAEAAAHGLRLLRASGLEAREAETGGWPALIGTADGPGPHVLIYGHYDVQPPGPLELWTTPPFVPSIRDGRMYGRGTGDNKGQNLAQLLGLRALRDLTGGYPCRVTVLLDGEEEIGSPNLAAAVRQVGQARSGDLERRAGARLGPGLRGPRDARNPHVRAACAGREPAVALGALGRRRAEPRVGAGAAAGHHADGGRGRDRRRVRRRRRAVERRPACRADRSPGGPGRNTRSDRGDGDGAATAWASTNAWRCRR